MHPCKTQAAEEADWSEQVQPPGKNALDSLGLRGKKEIQKDVRFFLQLSVRLDQLCNLLIHSEPPIQIFIYLFIFFKVALSIPQPVSFFVVTKADGKSHSAL